MIADYCETSINILCQNSELKKPIKNAVKKFLAENDNMMVLQGLTLVPKISFTPLEIKDMLCELRDSVTKIEPTFEMEGCILWKHDDKIGSISVIGSDISMYTDFMDSWKHTFLLEHSTNKKQSATSSKVETLEKEAESLKRKSSEMSFLIKNTVNPIQISKHAKRLAEIDESLKNKKAELESWKNKKTKYV
jgi:hypothetical protein